MNQRKKKFVGTFAVFGVAIIATFGQAQVVKFRLEATDASGTPIDSVMVGDEFHLKAYTQHMNGYVSEENAGVFAGYLDISYESSLASVAGAIDHSAVYQNGMSGDTSVAGLLNDIGGFSSSGDLGIGLEPFGLGEQFLFSVPIRADEVGELNFLGSESGSSPVHDVLVYGLNDPVPASEIDFGEVGTRIDFGAVRVSVVPEPGGNVLLAAGAIGIALWRRRLRS